MRSRRIPCATANSRRRLARVLGRPAVLRVPTFALRLALGEMADELLLSGTRAVPKRLSEGGFRFEHAEIEPALHARLED